MSVLVVGAGELGLATLEALSKHPNRNNTNISVLLRPSSLNSQDPAHRQRKAHMESLGVGFETGDFINDPTDLIPIFKKYDTVIQCAGYGMKPGTQLGVTRAVLEAGVRRYFPWQFGVDYEAIGKGSSQELFDEMLEVRALLRSQNTTKWTIVSTGLFMSYLFLPDFGVVDLRERKVRALGGWETAVTVTHPVDIGVMVAEAVFNPEDTEDRVIYIGGETVTYGGLAEKLDSIFSVKFEKEEWDLGFLKKKLNDNPQDLWAKYQNIFGEGVGVSWGEETTVNRQRGISLTSVASYVEANKGTMAAQLTQ